MGFSEGEGCSSPHFNRNEKIKRHGYSQGLLLLSGSFRPIILRTNTVNIRKYHSICKYDNFLAQREQILKDNKGKSGIYRFINKVSGKSYIGSAVNLSDRLWDYSSQNFLVGQLKQGKSMIYSSLLKNGHSNFKLEILEYCELSVLIEREQYYIDLLNPKYNILKIAGSLTGFQHSEETKAKMSTDRQGDNHPFFGGSHSKETKDKIRKALSGENHPLFGKSHSEETKKSISMAKLGKNYTDKKGENNPMYGKIHSDETIAKLGGVAIEVLDLETNITTSYSSIKKAAKAIGVSSPTISERIKKMNCFVIKGRYQIIKK